MNVLFMGGNELGGITLNHLVLNSINIVGVVISETNDSWYSGVDVVANKYNIPIYKEKDVNSSNFLESIGNLDLDLILCVNFNQILKKEIISIPKIGCINTHASLLPKYRGRAPLNWAMINGEKYTGVTVHFIDDGIDTGDILLQEKIEIDEHDYISDLLEKVKHVYPNIVLKSIKLLESNDFKLTTPDLSKGFYVSKRNKYDGKIDFSKGSKEILNFIKAISKPYPGAFIYYGSKTLVIWRAHLDSSLLNNYKNYSVGDIIIEDKFLIKLKDSILVIDEHSFEQINF
ncbi:methionyl-tRNA formyltransferase [Paraclostridium sordellii]|uniref:methionyl-tRNA formyltransferase n=1 Tax=Paraclostridium sordellii TaxID=1505 RepID=UPI0005DACE22|nr:methionyl-tRNA formyltransferase [Paeniclostridium sordellii]CEO20956.1 methionyl-tRNA formyltransferase [[Clostridium] sordellii] [Paeniclostridium sordellii]